jgi:hypothetical protein
MAKSKWTMPVFAFTLGLGLFAAELVGGSVAGAVISLAVMTAFALAILFGGRSETVRGLRGDGRDERFRQIDIAATAIAGTAVITAIIVAFMVEVARGHDGSPYTWLGAIAGLVYIAAVLVLRVRG